MEPKLPFDQHGKTASNGRERSPRVIKAPLAPSDGRIAPVERECSPTVERNNKYSIGVPSGQGPTPPTTGSRQKTRKGVGAAQKLLTVRQVAQNWKLSERSVRRRIKDGQIRIVRIGRSVRIPE